MSSLYVNTEQYFADTKRLELYPFGRTDAFSPHIDVNFTKRDRDLELVNLDIGVISFHVNFLEMPVDDMRVFADTLRLACEVAQRQPQPDWPTVLTTDAVFGVMKENER